MSTVRGAVRSGWSPAAARCRRRREPAPPIVPACSASTSASSSTIGPREVLTRSAVGFIRARSSAPIRPAGALGQQRWIVTTSDVREQLVLARPGGRRPRRRVVGVEVLAPGDDVHAERQPERATGCPSPPSPTTPERAAGEVARRGCAASRRRARRVLRRGRGGPREDERPGHLHGGAVGAAPPVPADGDAELACRGDVDGRVAPARSSPAAGGSAAARGRSARERRCARAWPRRRRRARGPRRAASASPRCSAKNDHLVGPGAASQSA